MSDHPVALPVAIALAAYVVVSYAIALGASRRVESSEDYLVAGRRLSLPLCTATLLATWFGAGTMLTAADEVRDEGLRAIALEPLGAALCLLIAGVWLAKPLWSMKLETLGDFFERRYGKRVELYASLVMVPGYFGWIAVQLVALAGVIELMVGIPATWGIALVAVVGVGYTLLGGMWAVTVTDAVQLVLLVIGLVILTFQVLATLGEGSAVGGLAQLAAELPPEMLAPIPTDSAKALLGWCGVLAVAALGNLPGQDLTQRIFAARSANVARTACILAGIGYLVFGAMPVLLGLSARVLAPAEIEGSIVPALAQAWLSPVTATIFVVALAGAVISTIDSAILAPAGVLAKNVLPRVVTAKPLSLDRGAVVGVAIASTVVAYLGESAYDLLESAYGLGLMALFVPLIGGLRRVKERETDRASEPAALAAMGLGGLSWLVHVVGDWDVFLAPLLAPAGVALPASLVTVVLTAAVYVVVSRSR